MASFSHFFLSWLDDAVCSCSTYSSIHSNVQPLSSDVPAEQAQALHIEVNCQVLLF